MSNPANLGQQIAKFLRAGSTARCLTVVCVLCAGFLAGAAEPRVRRLDGSTVSFSEIDETVTRLVSAAKVTGIGIAILNNRKERLRNRSWPRGSGSTS